MLLRELRDRLPSFLSVSRPDAVQFFPINGTMIRRFQFLRDILRRSLQSPAKYGSDLIKKSARSCAPRLSRALFRHSHRDRLQLLNVPNHRIQWETD